MNSDQPKDISSPVEPTPKSTFRRRFLRLAAASVPITAIVVAILLFLLSTPLKPIRENLFPPLSFQKEASIPLRGDQGLGPLAIDIDPAGEFAYVTVPKGDCFSAESASTQSLIGVIRLSDNQLVQTIKLPNWVLDVKVTPDGKFLYITNSFEDTITVFDLSTHQVVKTIPAGPNPTTADTTTCRTDFNYKPQFLVFSPKGNLAYTSNAKGGTVSVIDVDNQQFLDQIQLAPESPADPKTAPTILLWGIAHHPWKNLLYVGGKIGGKVFVVDTQQKKVTAEIQLDNEGFAPLGIAVDPKGEYLYVAEARNRQVLVFDTLTHRLRHRFSFTQDDGEPEWISFDKEGNLAFITHFGTNQISVIDVANQKVIGSFQGGKAPLMAVPDPSGQKILLGSREGKTVELFERNR